MCFEKCHLHPTYFVSVPRLAWQACLTTAGMKLELITDCDMILMIEKGTGGWIFQATHRYAKAKKFIEKLR